MSKMIHQQQNKINDLKLKITDLEAKLAEKEKENAKLKQVVETIDKLKQYNLDMGDYCLISQKHAEQYFNDSNQDKIELLEKVKLKVKKRNNGTKQAHYSIEYKDGYRSCSFDIEEYIDTLIKEIKGENYE